MIQRLQRAALVLLTAAALSTSAVASAPAAPADSIAPRLTLNYTHRMRIETWDNTVGLSKEAAAGTTWLRNRMSLTAQYAPKRNLRAVVKVTDEFRYHLVPENKTFTFDEIFIDQLYVTWDSITGRPISLTVGRQNMNFGEGFIIMDGSPLDGSRSAYFNAARCDWDYNPNHTVTAFYFYQPPKEQYLPVIHEQDKPLLEQPQEMFGLYWMEKVTRLNMHLYMIRQNISTTPERPQASHLTVIGMRAQGKVNSKLLLAVEAAYQSGSYGHNDLQATGGYYYAEYQTGWPGMFPQSFTLGMLCLSGDDPKTADHEGWEPMSGRWPKWSESYLYALIKEGGVGHWTNLASLFAKTAVKLAPDVDATFDYHHLMAAEVADPSLSFPGGCGRTRGDLFIVKITYQIKPRLSGHALFEHFDPGNYYFDGADDYLWTRLEVMLKF